MTDIAPSDQVTRRRVFYIPGYDPFPPRRYRELYRKESAAQAAISDYAIEVAPRSDGESFGWVVSAAIEGCQTTSDIVVLTWSDIVRASMKTSVPATYVQLARTAWIYISTGVLWRLMRLRKGPVIAALYPVGMLLLQLFLACLLGGAVFALGNGWLTPALGVLGQTGAAVLGALTAVVILRWFKAQDGRLFAYYLMHDYSFSAGWRGATPPAIERRIAEFTEKIALALTDDVDEVLVVGHSSGAHLAVSVLADLIRDTDIAEDGPKLAFLSLGQVVPMVAFLPEAHRLRADLVFLSQQPTLTWVDVTAPGDGCAFALCDPVAVTGVAPSEKRWPLVISAAFTQTLRPDTWKALRWRFFRLHFQYLCAFDNPGDYDYFQITAGPKTLAARFRNRQPSKSRIIRPISKYRSVA